MAEKLPPSDGNGMPSPLQQYFDLGTDIGRYIPGPLQPAWDFLQDYPLLLVLVLVALGYSLGKGLQWLVRTSLGKLVGRTPSELDDKAVRYLTQPIVQTTVILALTGAVKAFRFSESMDWFLIRVLFSLLLIFWGRAWFRAASIGINFLSQQADRFEIFQPRTRPLFEIGIKLFLLGFLIWLFMALWDIDGTAWLASAGVIGIAVGFAARDTLANLIAGVSIIADAPYRIGDYIRLETGERGVVTEVGMRSTRILTRDDVEISIPNSVMGNAKIINESGGPAIEHRIRVPVGVAYGTLPARVVEVLDEVARDNKLVLPHPAPRVRMRAFGESSLDFELLGWVRLPEQAGLARHNLLMEIEEKFREEGIEIPFPQRDVHLKGAAQPPAGDG